MTQPIFCLWCSCGDQAQVRGNEGTCSPHVLMCATMASALQLCNVGDMFLSCHQEDTEDDMEEARVTLSLKSPSWSHNYMIFSAAKTIFLI